LPGAVSIGSPSHCVTLTADRSKLRKSSTTVLRAAEVTHVVSVKL
jgi:hypothetical protein